MEKKTPEEILAQERDSWGDILTLTRSKEGRKILVLGYKMIIGFGPKIDHVLTDEEKAKNYERLILRTESRQHHRASLLAKLAVNAAALVSFPKPDKVEEYLNNQTVTSMNLPRAESAVEPTALPEAA